MSEKKRRDITLGEMQDACVAYDCDKCDPCFKSLCALMTNELGEMKAPKFWNLTDPPRFTEAQMAFWRGWYGIGAVFAHRSDATNSSRCVHIRDAEYNYLGYLQIEYDALPIKCGETIDLAELIGKDGAE